VDVFDLRDRLIDDYRHYVGSFMALRDRRIRERVLTNLDEGTFWPGPRIGLNPAFEPGGWIDDLVAEGLLHPLCSDIERKDVATYGEYRTKRLVLEVYDAMATAAATNTPYTTLLEPGPAEAAVAHAASSRPSWSRR
jgi:hypothetical protein